jgi:hypothetical protein
MTRTDVWHISERDLTIVAPPDASTVRLAAAGGATIVWPVRASP